MAQTNILLESGTNELEIVEFYLDEGSARFRRLPGIKNYKGYYGVNVAKVLEIIRLPRVTELAPGALTPRCSGAFNLRNHIIPLVDLSIWLGKDPHRNWSRPRSSSRSSTRSPRPSWSPGSPASTA